jgi:serine/threonine-protein kinase
LSPHRRYVAFVVRCPACSTPCAEAYRFCVDCGADLRRSREDDSADPILGSTLPGGYRVTHLVGIGGMGHVYCAEQVALGRTVAVKVVHPHLAGDELATARFLNEARAASRLSHPNSVAIFDFGRTANGCPYIVMEYLRGRDLAQIALAEGPLPFRRIVHVLQQTLAALDEAHALGILHRDVKPDNIVLEPLRSSGDFVKVVDFGLAKVLADDPGSLSALSQPGLVCGTPEYMSPEQGRGDLLDARSDLYSVGVVLCELLTGQLPFTGVTQSETILLHLNEPPPDPRRISFRPIPAPFAELTLRALAKPREDRPQNAREFAEALEQALVASDDRRSDPSGPVTAIRCGSCGGLSPVGQKFCGDCGASMAVHLTSTAPPARAVKSRASLAATVPRFAAPPLAVVPAAMPLPFVGRDDVVQWLEARRGEGASMPAMAHLVGELGVGRTRLVEEMMSRWKAQGSTVVCAAPDPYWAKIADFSIRQAIRDLTGLTDHAIASRPWDGANHETRHGLQVLFGSTPSAIGPHERRAVLAEALRWSLEYAERRTKAAIVLVIDDLDYVDGTSRNAFADVLVSPPAVPALILATYEDKSRPVPSPEPRESWQLAPLSGEALAFLLPSHTSDGPLVPLHVEQLVAWSHETMHPAPSKLTTLIGRRLDRLPADARQVLQALAVWGNGADIDTLGNLVSRSADIVLGLDALARAGFATITASGVHFRHPLFRRVAFASLPAGRREDLVARCVAIRNEAPLELRARHAMHGASTFEALSLLDALGTQRASHGDLDGAVSALRHALDITRRDLHRDGLEDPLAAMLLFSRKLAEALSACRRWTDADGVLREALGNAPPASEHRAHLLGVLAHVANSRRHPDEARRYLDEALRVARQSDARELLPLLEQLDRTIAVA